MSDRGTYGNGRSANGYPALVYSNYAAPVLGIEPSTRRVTFGLGSLLLSMGAGAIVGHLIGKDQNKSIAFGALGGFFAHHMMEQTFSLKNIDRQLTLSR